MFNTAVYVWLRDPQVTFDANGGTVNIKTFQAIYGSAFGALPSPTRKGYTFSGWYTQKTGGTKITASTTVTQTEDITLYARWKKVTTAKASISKVSSSKSGRLNITVKTVKGASGYQIICATDKALKTNKKSTIVSKNTATVTGLKKGKTYYVKVRAFKTDSTGGRVFGSYSTVKTVKVK